ncbi:MAG: hypothetical protein P1U44_03150 [Vicingaceae bacterium]|nr:hypothetical protein [Flavobacteriales bacterium]MDF1674689.1 hypothetical protein [Vicingaceae bacterium]|tara:strand:- start:77 stop:307 length:231 start_codon:yes stop_codon:yes gene_type:complete
MKRLQELTKEINTLTLKIEQEYPELYQYLDENPLTIPCCDQPKVDTKNFSDYLDSLKQLLEHHVESHEKVKNNQSK